MMMDTVNGCRKKEEQEQGQEAQRGAWEEEDGWQSRGRRSLGRRKTSCFDM